MAKVTIFFLCLNTQLFQDTGTNFEIFLKNSVFLEARKIQPKWLKLKYFLAFCKHQGPMTFKKMGHPKETMEKKAKITASLCAAWVFTVQTFTGWA